MKQTELNDLFIIYVQQIRAKGIMYKDIYTKLDISNQHFTNMRKGSSNVSFKHIEVIEEEFKQFITNPNERKLVTDTNNKLVAIPLYNVDVMAGNLMNMFNDVQSEYITSHINAPNFADGKFAVTVYGDSASPKYNGGDVVILGEKITNGGEIEYGRFYVIVTKTSRYIKKIMPEDDEHLSLHSLNENYPPMQIEKENIIGLFKVLGKIEREGL